jgi:hypothetical protein
METVCFFEALYMSTSLCGVKAQKKQYCSLYCSQGPAIGPYPEQVESNPQLHTHFLKIHSLFITPRCNLGLHTLRRIQFSNTLNLRTSITMRKDVSQLFSYKTTSSILCLNLHVFIHNTERQNILNFVNASNHSPNLTL